MCCSVDLRGGRGDSIREPALKCGPAWPRVVTRSNPVGSTMSKREKNLVVTTMTTTKPRMTREVPYRSLQATSSARMAVAAVTLSRARTHWSKPAVERTPKAASALPHCS